MRIKEIEISKLKAYGNNPRQNDNAADAVAQSIKEFGFKNPIIIDKNNVIVAGHTRIKAAVKLGLETVPCIVADDLAEEQIKAFRIADNKTAELADWDIELLYNEIEELRSLDFDINKLGFGENELKGIADEYAELMDAESEAEDDVFNLELPEEPKTKPGDLYILGEHRLLCGDATKAESYARLTDGAEADLLLTDVPYNVDYKKKTDALKKFRPSNRVDEDMSGDKLSGDDYISFIKTFMDNASSNLKSGGCYYIWHAYMLVREIMTAINLEPHLVRQHLVWVKHHFSIKRFIDDKRI